MGSAPSYKEDFDKELMPLHLMVSVDQCKGFSCISYYPFLEHVNSGAIYNFISQAVAYCNSLAAARKRKPPPIGTVISMPLDTTAMVLQMIFPWDRARGKKSHAINFTIVNISYYNLILSMS
jgi:hypothetical protein